MPYALTSELLKGNRRLQDCANDHRWHVMLTNPPERGEHVKLIQQALSRLGYTGFDEAELRSSAYGKTTAEMVFRFKDENKPKKILGPGQTVPDKIVGVQTIRRLDERLGGGGGGGTSGGADADATTFTMSPARVLRAQVFWLSSAAVPGDPTGVFNPVPAYLKAANALLAKHNMSIRLSPGSQPESLVSFDDELEDFTRGPTGTLSRARAAVNSLMAPGAIFVIVGKFKEPFSPSHRAVLGHTQHSSPFFAFDTTLFLNSRRAAKDGMTLLHEMGHAAGADKGGRTEADWESEALARNFMSHSKTSTLPRDQMMRWQADALAGSFFGGNA